MRTLALRFLLGVLLAMPSLAQRELSGTARIRQSLEKLRTTGTVLMIAAHPDDENSALLAYLARGRHFRTGYLSLTRGEGGQNLIGPEQGYELGVIRTQELLAARRIDGAEQFFTSAVDFGFSKTAEETLRIWGHDKVLEEVIGVIRSFRPDVIVLRFSGTPRDGHGQHQASAMLAKEAFQILSNDPWHPVRLMWNLFQFSAEQEREAEQTKGRIGLDTGEYNPVLGFSYAEIAGMSRSMHKSQGFGAPERKGSQVAYLVTTAGQPAAKDILDGVDPTWNRVRGGAAIAKLLDQAITNLDDAHPERIIPTLLEARTAASKLDDPIAKRKMHEFDDTIAACAGLWMDANAPAAVQVEGSTVNVELTALNRSESPLSWDGSPLEYNKPAHKTVDILAKSGVKVPIYINASKQPLEFDQPVDYRWVDPVRGELTRDLVAVPAVSVNVPEAPLMFPNAQDRSVIIRLLANAPVKGELHLQTPDGWRAEPAKQTFALKSSESATLTFLLKPPSGSETGMLRAAAHLSDGREVTAGIKVIDYPHIPTQTLFPPAAVKLVRAEIQTLAKNIGYVMGAGDDMPEALRQMGCDVVLLSDDDLARGDLARFDAIVTGVRAYDVRDALKRHSDRLLAYAKSGGTVVVQYNKLESERGRTSNFVWGPYPFQLGRGRVTEEDAPVEFTDPSSPLLHKPNQIAPPDFGGWIQERGLYFPSEWEANYKTLFRCHDAGESPLEGSTLYTAYGKGAWVYTAFSWFRELPAGVPGAYRIFANLISAGKVLHE